MDATPSTAANSIASRSVTLPMGSGRCRVRPICASMRWSMSWLSVAALAAASAMPMLPNTSASSGGRPGVASNVPTMAVSTISATTFGFVSVRYSRQRPRAEESRVWESLVAKLGGSAWVVDGGEG